MSPFPIIEKLTLVAPLGLCFHDAATGERVIDGLTVHVSQISRNARKKRFEALPNPSGVYVLHRADGLEEFTRGSGDEQFWSENPPQKEFVVEVVDREARFVPFKFALKLPVRGIYRWENAPLSSPNKSLSSIPLYSSPSRKTLGGMAIVRAELRESTGIAAAYAVLEARFGGVLAARGIADGDGKIALMFPALAPQSNPVTSPPGNATRVSLADQIWNLDLSLKYEPQIFDASPPVFLDSDEGLTPDLRLVLAQSPGSMWADEAQTESLTSAVLSYGRELILRSRVTLAESPPTEETTYSSYLYVSPA